MTISSPLLKTVATPTDYWNDSCSIEELTYAIGHGAVRATTNPNIVLNAVSYTHLDVYKRQLHDIAVSTGVSVSTVSLVLNDRPGISTQTRSRVLEAAAKLGYELTPSVQNQQTSNTIGLLIEQGSMHALLDIFYGDIIRGFQTEAQRLGYQVLLHMYDRHNEGLDAVSYTHLDVYKRQCWWRVIQNGLTPE